MGLPLITSPRRSRLWLAAVCMTVLIIYYNYNTPLSQVKDQTGPSNAVLSGPELKEPEDDWRDMYIVEDSRGSETEPANIPTPAVKEAVAPTTPTVNAEVDAQAEGETTPDSQIQVEDVVVFTATATTQPSPTCTPFEQYMASKPGPPSAGKRQFPYMRPPPECRTFKLPALEDLLERMKTVIKDPDLYRLFENSYPITLDTMVKWRGYANTTTDLVTGTSTITDEELTYVITGDIDAMWLRDSASQIYSYLPLLTPSTDQDSLASLWRGLINAHARYINISPYCHSFQPPPESGIPPTRNAAYSQNHPNPSYDPQLVFDCKWELDSLASFLQISVAYHAATADLSFFSRYNWVSAVRSAVDAAGAMRKGTYDDQGRVLPSAWTFTGWTDRGSETLTNNGLGNPVKENGMVRTGFRPSDDATIFQLLVPANMMWAKYLEEASVIMELLDTEESRNLTGEMRSQAAGIRRGIERDAIVPWPGAKDGEKEKKELFAYEVDGFGEAGLMDDANVPSLLAMPLWNFTRSRLWKDSNKTAKEYDEIYQHTREFILSPANPYYAQGPVISAVGGPHIGPGKAWPMAAIVAGMTAYDGASGLEGEELEKEVEQQLRMVLDSTAGMGVVHETVDSWQEQVWTRPWFGWANGLFGELVLRIEREEKIRGTGKEGLLGRSWQ